MRLDQIVKIGEILVIKYEECNIRTKVQDVLDDNGLVVLQPTLKGIPMTAREDQILEITFFRENGVFTFNALMKETFTANDVRLSKFIAVSEIIKKQRRECFRLMKVLDVIMQKVDDKGIIEEKKFRGKTSCISEKSFQVTSFSSFLKGTKIVLTIDLEEMMMLQTEVLICEKPVKKSEPFQIVLLFENCTNKERTKISKYILRQQIIARKKNEDF